VVVHEVFLEAMVNKSEYELSHVDIGVGTILCTQTGAYLDLHFPEEGGRRGGTLEFALTMIKPSHMLNDSHRRGTRNLLQNRDIYVHELNFVSCYLYHSSMTTKKEQEKTENKKNQGTP